MRAWAHIAAWAFLYWPASMVLASQDPMESASVKACQHLGAPLSKVMAQLSGDGWSLVPAPTPEIIEDMAWINATFYFAGDPVGAELDNVMEIQRKAAQGFFRKVDIPQSQTRMLQHVDRLDHMMVMRRLTNNQLVTLECRVALRQIDLPSGLKAQLNQVPLPQDIQFLHLQPETKGEMRYDIKLIRATAERELPSPQAIIFTYARSQLSQSATQ